MTASLGELFARTRDEAFRLGEESARRAVADEVADLIGRLRTGREL